MKFPILVVCEGSSEANYLAQLNRLVVSEDGRQVFVAREAEGGRPNLILRALKKFRQINRNQPFWIFLDKDIYVREKNLEQVLMAKAGNAYICFNRMNFEDVVMLHESYPKLSIWLDFCRSQNHFEVPLEEKIYLPKLKEIIPDYQKRALPFELTRERVETAFNNLKEQSDIQSTFLLELEKLINNGNVLWRGQF